MGGNRDFAAFGAEIFPHSDADDDFAQSKSHFFPPSSPLSFSSISFFPPPQGFLVFLSPSNSVCELTKRRSPPRTAQHIAARARPFLLFFSPPFVVFYLLVYFPLLSSYLPVTLRRKTPCHMLPLLSARLLLPFLRPSPMPNTPKLARKKFSKRKERFPLLCYFSANLGNDNMNDKRGKERQEI